MVSTNMLEQPNFTVWLSKCLKNKLFSPKLSLKSQPVSSRRDCQDRKKATLVVIMNMAQLIGSLALMSNHEC